LANVASIAAKVSAEIEIVTMRPMWVLDLPIGANLTLGARPIGRSDSRNRP
jgi:hypothetical protein